MYTNPYILYKVYRNALRKEYLGEFEELVLTMVAVLGQEAYGNAIVTEIKDRIGREVNLSAVHVTLYRLEDKGYLTSEMGGASNNRGGRRKLILCATKAGMEMLQAVKNQRQALLQLLPNLQFSGMI